MFLHLSVILFTVGGVSVPACTTGHMTRGVSVQGGGLCLGGSLSRGVSVQGGWGLCQGDPLPRQRPPYGNERAVRILLECILVHYLRNFFSLIC